MNHTAAVGQQDGAGRQAQAGANQGGGGHHIERAFHDGVKQQHRKQEVIDQAFHLLPHGAVLGGEAADQIAAQNQGKVGKEELGKVHSARITAPIDLQGTQLSPWGDEDLHRRVFGLF